MSAPIEQLDPQAQEQLRQHLEISDNSELPAPEENYEEILSFFGEQYEALKQEVEVVKTRIAYLRESLPQYIEQAGGSR